MFSFIVRATLFCYAIVVGDAILQRIRDTGKDSREAWINKAIASYGSLYIAVCEEIGKIDSREDEEYLNMTDEQRAAIRIRLISEANVYKARMYELAAERDQLNSN